MGQMVKPHRWSDLTGKELELWYTLEQEYQDGRYLKAIREERNRREKYDY